MIIFKPNTNNNMTLQKIDNGHDAASQILDELLRQEKVICPECLKRVTQEELDMFGGLCEECSGVFD